MSKKTRVPVWERPWPELTNGQRIERSEAIWDEFLIERGAITCRRQRTRSFGTKDIFSADISYYFPGKGPIEFVDVTYRETGLAKKRKDFEKFPQFPNPQLIARLYYDELGYRFRIYDCNPKHPSHYFRDGQEFRLNEQDVIERHQRISMMMKKTMNESKRKAPQSRKPAPKRQTKKNSSKGPKTPATVTPCQMTLTSP